MKANKAIATALCLYACMTSATTAFAQSPSDAPSGLSKKDFGKFWEVESEAADYAVSFSGDTADIISPKGLTLWRKEKMGGRTVVEYDACVVVRGDGKPYDRASDLNCFWMASDPKHPDNIMKRKKERKGVFVNTYALQLYYLGYGGNYNTTTRFRRYDGDERAINDEKARPAILTEYTDEKHLLKANHWYHIRITAEGGRTCYYIDGERLVDFRDPKPLTEGWFGFRTTLSHVRITNFRFHCEEWQPKQVPLQRIGDGAGLPTGLSWGVPFDRGAVSTTTSIAVVDGQNEVPSDTWPLAYWPDGSIKWLGVAATLSGSGGASLKVGSKQKKTGGLSVANDSKSLTVKTRHYTAFLSPVGGQSIVDSLLLDGLCVAKSISLVALSKASLDGRAEQHVSKIESIEVERAGSVRACIKATGKHKSGQGREWLPFVVRLYLYDGSDRIDIKHTFTYDGDQDNDFIAGLGLQFQVPLRDEAYNRHVAFTTANGGVWTEPIQPLDGRRELTLPHSKTEHRADESLPPHHHDTQSLQSKQMLGQRIPSPDSFDERNQKLLHDWAAWDGYRLSQTTPDGFTIRKRATPDRPWIGTAGGHRADGCAWIGDTQGGLAIAMADFWQAAPSSLEIGGARSETATMTAWLWSPEAEPMDLRHYDDVPHGLEASYEDVQEGMSTPYGIARTSCLAIRPTKGYAGKASFAQTAKSLTQRNIITPTPQYLHDRQAFGTWSMPDSSTPARKAIEDRLALFVEYYKQQVEQHRWYGFWNYGDFMHAYDAERHEWRYDVGGFAWDNTELASPLWLWYSFLRTGREDIWQMAEAMARHVAEVDVYHIGPNAMLGSRHNVSHWGCGAKEARISQTAWNRIYYYLTTDERTGDLMTAVRDADKMLYTIDPMRLAQPRGEFPCTAPARLRIGPDWMAYACNWMTEWERTQNTTYRDKIATGMNSIAALPNRIFTGPLALGYDPATGVISSECDTSLQTTNHLMTIMGGFEVMNEMIPLMDNKSWDDAYLDLAINYKWKAHKIRGNNFPVTRLLGYAAFHTNDKKFYEMAWKEMQRMMPRDNDKRYDIVSLAAPEVPAPQTEMQMMSTNGAATWSLDAIYLMEVCPPKE